MLKPLPNLDLFMPHIFNPAEHLLPDEVQRPLPQSLGDHEQPQNCKLVIGVSWKNLRSSL